MVTSLVLSTGGVAYRIKADPQQEARRVAPAAPTTPANADEAGAETPQAAEPGSCPAAEGASPKPVVIRLERLPSPKGFIPLNSSGYNYSDPRRVPAIVPEPTSPEPASAEAAAPVPATPAERD